ncbi:MAG: hypothetical protein MZU91_02220 [Desulfosudis oleivorans]|nr:hypothetical protein [Desulfosudis oleivorans]
MPLLLPEINAEHIQLVKASAQEQRLERMHRYQPELHEHGADDCAQGFG